MLLSSSIQFRWPGVDRRYEVAHLPCACTACTQIIVIGPPYAGEGVFMPLNGFMALSEEIAEMSKRSEEEYDFHRMQALEDENLLLRAVVENFPGGIALTDKNLRLAFCNEHLKRMLDYPPSLFAFGNPSLEQLFRFNATRGEYGPGAVEEHVAKRMELVRQRTAHTYQRTRPNGLKMEVRGVPVAGGGFMTTYVEITNQPVKTAVPEVPADVDALTGLQKPAAFQDQLDEFLRHLPHGHVAALHCMDLDHFRAINKHYGRPAGDHILREIGARLKGLLRGNDPVARIGGDRFIVLQHEVKRPSDVARLANRILLEISRPVQVGSELVSISSSIGFALVPRDGHDVETLMDKVQVAVLATKERSRGSFEPESAQWE